MTTIATEDRARLAQWIDRDLPALAPVWLAGQRWFGGKSQAISVVGITDVFWLPVETAACALVVLDVHGATSQPGLTSPAHYAVVVGSARSAHGSATIGQLRGQPDLYAVEATAVGPAAYGLLRGLATGLPLPGDRGGAITYADASPRVRDLLTAGPDGFTVAPVGVEQSNTSVRVGTSHVFKLFRRLEEGLSPQLELGRFLTRTSFRAAPPLEGSLVYRATGGQDCALGALDGWVANAGDGWSYVVAALRHGPSTATRRDDLVQDLFGLGTTTADFHVALASDASLDAFAPEPVTPADRDQWQQQILAQAERAFDLVEHHHARWPEPAATIGRTFQGARHLVATRLRPLGTGPLDPFEKIRTHGDFHLGQTLKTPGGFAIIDFEGEPAKPLAERRQKHCALRDVAGMLRSLDYAAVAAHPPLPGATEMVDTQAAVGDLRHAFIHGYRSRAASRGARFLPPTQAAIEAWIRLFELDRALYEVEYEVNNRPAWAPIPLRAVMDLLAGPR